VRILLATDVFPPKSGGSGWSTFYLARALIQRGHQVQVVQPKLGGQGIQSREYEGVPVVEVGYAASTLPGVRAWQRTPALESTLVSYLVEQGRAFDVIHAQHLLTIPAAVSAKKISNVPIVSTVRDYWHVCLYGTLWREHAICPTCHGVTLTRCLAQQYGNAAQFMLPLVPLVERELKRRQRALQESDAVIAVSRYVAETLAAIVLRHKIFVLPNLIDVQETQKIAETQKRQISNQTETSKPYLLFVGKLNALKGADLLSEIMQQSGVALPLVIVGDGEFRQELTNFPSISVLGWLSNAETLGLLAGAQALLFPSRWAEPLARTLLEAQALGVPTVALNTGGTRDIIEGDFNGLLAANVDEFAVQLRRLVGDAELRHRLSENARRVAQDKFSPDVVVPQLETIYESVR